MFLNQLNHSKQILKILIFRFFDEILEIFGIFAVWCRDRIYDTDSVSTVKSNVLEAQEELGGPPQHATLSNIP